MGKIAFVFAGQGAQRPGMGMDLYNNFDEVKSVFNEAEQLRKGTLVQCFAGTEEELRETKNTQPCLYLTDLAGAIALRSKGIIPDGVAGFSLGEIPALAFAGAYSYQDGFRIACKRGEFMSEVSSATPSSMIAVLKLPAETVEKICAEKYKNVYPANYNSKGQTVVSGSVEELERFKFDITEQGGAAIPLSVSAGFHSPFMNKAANKLGEFLAQIEIKAPEIPVYSNYTALPYDKDVITLLTNQVNNPVRWELTIRNMTNDGFDTFIEVGVGKVLTNLIKKIAPECKCYSVEDTLTLEAVLKELAYVAR